MALYKRLPAQKPRPANEFATRLDAAYHWMEHNWRAVLFGIGGTAVVAAAILLISFYAGKRDEKAKELFFQAARLAEAGGDPVSAYQKAVDSYPSSGIAQVARLKISDIWYSRGDYEKAEEALNPLINAKDPLIRMVALDNLGAALVAKGESEKAAEIYLKAYADGKNPDKGRSYFNAAMAYVQAGGLDEAKRIFEELSREETDYSSPDLKARSREQLIWLAVKKR